MSTERKHEPYKGYEVSTGEYMHPNCIYYKIGKDGIVVFDTLWIDLHIWQTHEAAYERAKQEIDERGHLGADPAKWMQPKEIEI